MSSPADVRPRVGVVTDSTANLDPARASAAGVEVVPLSVLVDDVEYNEGVDPGPDGVVGVLRRGRQVSTSRPSPGALLRAYEHLAGRGVGEIVSVHLSARLSGTCEAASLAARAAPVPVRVVDSRAVGLALGFATLTGAAAAAEGRSAAEVVERVHACADDTRVVFYVHTLEQLRRGGRIGAAAALLGNAFGVKPVLALVDGQIEPVERVRTTGRAVARLVDLATHAARVYDAPVRIAVQHVDAQERASHVAQEVSRALADGVADSVEVAALTSVIATHLGPGAVAVVVAPGDAPA